MRSALSSTPDCSAGASASASAPCVLSLPSDVLSHVHSFLSGSELLCALLPTARAYGELVREDALLWQGQCRRAFDVPAEEGEAAASSHGEPAWFCNEEQEDEEQAHFAHTAAAATPAASSSSSAAAAPSPRTNRWLRLYRSFALTPPRPLRLEVLYTDDRGYVAPPHHFPGLSAEQVRDMYGVDNLLRPHGKAFCSNRKKNVHVVMALARTERQKREDEGNERCKAAATAAAAAASAAPISPLSSSASASASSAATSHPYPSSFCLTDCKIIAPRDGYTSPLSAGFLFFTDALPTPAQISAWDDWSEQQWADRERRRKEGGRDMDSEEVTRGEGEADDAKEDEEEARVESWYDDVAVPRTRPAPSVPAAFPLLFHGAPCASPSASSVSSSAALSFPTTAAPPSPPLAPLVAFFRLERNGTVAVESESALEPPLPLALRQVPYAYRHRFQRPVYGRFIVLTFLRSSAEKSNIDVSYVGVKGYRRGMHAVQVQPPAVPTDERMAADACGDESDASASSVLDQCALSGANAYVSDSPPSIRVPVSSPSSALASPAAAAHPDEAEDAFDFDAPLASTSGGGLDLPRLRQYLRSVTAMGEGMQADVNVLGDQLARVQSVLDNQQAVHQQQHALRLRMLLLQTQQLQLQLTAQQLQTQAALQHAARLTATASNFLAQRREQAAAIEAERNAHRTRLLQLTEEREREERLLVTLRARVAEAKEREERLQESVHAHRAAAAAAEAQRERLMASRDTMQPQTEETPVARGPIAAPASVSRDAERVRPFERSRWDGRDGSLEPPSLEHSRVPLHSSSLTGGGGLGGSALIGPSSTASRTFPPSPLRRDVPPYNPPYSRPPAPMASSSSALSHAYAGGLASSAGTPYASRDLLTDPSRSSDRPTRSTSVAPPAFAAAPLAYTGWMPHPPTSALPATPSYASARSATGEQLHPASVPVATHSHPSSHLWRSSVLPMHMPVHSHSATVHSPAHMSHAHAPLPPPPAAAAAAVPFPFSSLPSAAPLPLVLHAPSTAAVRAASAARTEALLASLRASRTQREQEHARRLAEATRHTGLHPPQGPPQP